MPQQRGYRDGCGIAHGLELVGERWAMLIVRELLLGPKRFTDLRDGLPMASPNVLTQRLRELTDAGVLTRRRLPPPAAAQVYELTDWGRRLEPIVIALGDWALDSPLLDPEQSVGVESFLLTLRTYYRPGPTRAVVGIVPTDHPETSGLTIRVRDGVLTPEHGLPDTSDATITASVADLLGALGSRPVSKAASADRRLTITGDRDLAREVLRSVHAQSGAARAPTPVPPQTRGSTC